MASGPKDAISHEICKIEEQEKKIANRKSTLFNIKNTISCWKANELEFYDCLLKKMSDTKSFSMKVESQIQSVINKQQHNFPDNPLCKQRIKCRERENRKITKSEKRKEMRIYKGCGSVLGVIKYDKLFVDDASQGKFQFQIEAASINPNAMDALKPKLQYI